MKIVEAAHASEVERLKDEYKKLEAEYGKSKELAQQYANGLKVLEGQKDAMLNDLKKKEEALEKHCRRRLVRKRLRE